MTANRFFELVTRGDKTVGLEPPLPSAGEGQTGRALVRIVQAMAPGWDAHAYGTRDLSGDWYTKIANLGTEGGGFRFLRGVLALGDYALTGVMASKHTGRLEAEPVTYHWVVVTGMSREWGRGREWEWFRIYNPFPNTSEYYPANVFHGSWNYGDKAWRDAVVVSGP